MELTPKLAIVGMGPGSPEYVTPRAARAIAEAQALIGSSRLLELCAGNPAAERVEVGAHKDRALAEIAARHPRLRVAVVVSGDTGLCSLAGPVLERFGRAACEVIPGVSALQVAFARVGLDWSDVRIVDAHGAPPDLPAAALAPEAKAAVLLGSARAREWLAEVADLLRPSHAFVACSNLTMPDERVREVEPPELHRLARAPRTILLVLRKDLWP